jgi:uncharacterized protein YndB with AHSA1/START domain
MQTQQPLVIERSYNAPVEKVWKAITDKSQMKQWYFDLDDFRPEVGFEFKFDGGSDDKVYHHICRIVEVAPCKKLKYSWSYEGFEGMSYVTFELFTEGITTKVRLTHEGLETFPQNNRDFARESFTQGWTFILGTSLKKFLEKQAITAG